MFKGRDWLHSKMEASLGYTKSCEGQEEEEEEEKEMGEGGKTKEIMEGSLEKEMRIGHLCCPYILFGELSDTQNSQALDHIGYACRRGFSYC